MTAMELAERIDEGEVELWAIEDMLRIEDTRYAQMDARLKAKVSG